MPLVADQLRLTAFDPLDVARSLSDLSQVLALPTGQSAPYGGLQPHLSCLHRYEDGKMHRMQRFDDLVRSERYSTATLLPAILLHDNFTGLDPFLRLVDAQGERDGRVLTLYDRDGTPIRQQSAAPGPSHPDAEGVELITEFHIARDLRFKGLLPSPESEVPLDGDVEPPKRDAPDLVIVMGDELVVCEGKFFGACELGPLNAQLRSQRVQVRHLFDVRPSLRPYRHVALLPITFREHPECTAVVTWDDIARLSEDVLGPEHYVTRRLQAAVQRYLGLLPVPTESYYDGILPWPNLLARCEGAGRQAPGRL